MVAHFTPQADSHRPPYSTTSTDMTTQSLILGNILKISFHYWCRVILKENECISHIQLSRSLASNRPHDEANFYVGGSITTSWIKSPTGERYCSLWEPVAYRTSRFISRTFANSRQSVRPQRPLLTHARNQSV